jgi:hypothetical protein
VAVVEDAYTSAEPGPLRTRSRLAAAGRVAVLYVIVQLISYALLLRSCSALVVDEVWLYGALGPLAAFEAIPRFQYHSWLGNAGFVIGALVIFAAPLAHVAWPRRLTLAVSCIALVIWCLYGLGFSIDHM